MGMTTAERRAYRQICGEEGAILVVAADQRGGMREVLGATPEARAAIDEAALGRVKMDIAAYLAVHAGAILVDPVCALPEMVDRDVLPRATALVVGLDASGYDVTEAGGRRSRMVPGMTARRVRALGGTAAKIMVYLRGDCPEADAYNLGLLRDAIADFAAEDVLLVTEFLTYRLPDETAEAYRAAMPGMIVAGCRTCLRMGAKVLKIAYPGSPEACAEVTAAAGEVPWALLSAGVDHAAFLPQVEIAMAAGASGVIAGRALWKDCIALDRAETRARLEAVAVPRLREIRSVIARHFPK